MTLGIEEVVFPALRDRSVRFVFPSEICAEAWLARSLSAGGARALEADRFLGWDRLKEEAARIEGRKAVDDSLRRIFSAALLAENAERPFLGSIIPPAFAGEWRPFAGYVASRLPALGRLPAALRAAGAEGDPRAGDWLALRARYEEFLRVTGRFEPSYEPRALRALNGTTIVFFPELIGDFEEYREALSGSPSLRLVGLPPGRPKARLRRPQTALAELRETLSEVGALLERGGGAAGIALTVAGLGRYRPYLEREATLLSVPIALRSGLGLDETPGGRLFAAMREAHASGFSYDALRDLLLSSAWPWRDPDSGSAILREGRRLHAIASWPEGSPKGGTVRKVDAWESSLSGALKARYRDLKGKISAIASARDFKSLLRSYNVFKSDFLSREGWDPIADKTLASCIDKLKSLVEAEEELGSGIATPDAFGVFMGALEATPYVSAAGAAGVPVFDWRVAAGAFPGRHFILGASQEALAVPSRSFDFLGESLRDRLGASQGRRLGAREDAGPDFIKAYALSGASVSFSCPQVGWDGEEAAHGFLVSMSAEESAEPADAAYREEGAWLSGRGPLPPRLHRVQAEGIVAAASAGTVASGDGAFLERATAKAAAELLKRPSHGSGEKRPSIDSTAIDYYQSCPFAYLYLRLLGAGPEPSGIEFVDDFFLGDVYHSTLALLFERIRDLDGRYRPDRVDSYRALLGRCLEEAFARLARSRGPFVAIVLEAYRGRLEGYLSRLLEAEAARFANLEVGPIEEELELEYPEVEGGVVLRGRIDRISRSEGGAVIVDYKKGRIPDRASVAPDDAGAIAEAQIPCYLRLASAGRSAAAETDSAWYVTIEGHDRRAPGSAVCAFGGSAEDKPYVSREGLGRFLEAFDAALRRTVEGIHAGAYPFAPKESQKSACRECGARGICRERYALRFGSAGFAGASGGGRT
jgi:hypothetical protein